MSQGSVICLSWLSLKGQHSNLFQFRDFSWSKEEFGKESSETSALRLASALLVSGEGCIYACICMSGKAQYLEGQRPKADVTRLVWLASLVWKFLVFASPVLDYSRVTTPSHLLTWVLGIWTLILRLLNQALHTLYYLPEPPGRFFKTTSMTSGRWCSHWQNIRNLWAMAWG